jgi:hypothetical protein
LPYFIELVGGPVNVVAMPTITSAPANRRASKIEVVVSALRPLVGVSLRKQLRPRLILAIVGEEDVGHARSQVGLVKTYSAKGVRSIPPASHGVQP